MRFTTPDNIQPESLKTLIVIGGPTASGKTAISIELARYFQCPILSADSRQCYRELNIAVAKPDPGQLEEIPHYFINSHSVHEEVSAGIYATYGLSILEKLFHVHDTLICVGGTGLYIKALCEGLDEMPAVPAGLNASLKLQYEVNGLTWLQAEIREFDPLFAETHDMQNPSRILRALAFARTHQRSILEYRKGVTQSRSFNTRYFAVSPAREQLYTNIHERVDRMIAQGLEEEARSLFPLSHLTALQTVGYTEWFRVFRNEISAAQAIEKIRQHTRNYAKRQVTWFSRQGSYQPIDGGSAQVLDLLRVR